MRKYIKYLIPFIYILMLSTSQADNYEQLDNHTYLNSLIQPDNQTSCCGDGDAYVVKSTESCTPEDFKNYDKCKFVAILGKQPESFQKHQTIKLSEGTRAVVPINKIRKIPSTNPTGYDIIFLYVYTKSNSVGTICWEPASRS